MAYKYTASICSFKADSLSGDVHRLQLVHWQLLLQEATVVLGRKLSNEYDTELVIGDDQVVAGVFVDARLAHPLHKA